MRTHKETIIFVLEGLIAQGGLSIEDGVCKYRSVVNGQKRCCAAGLLIPDKDYKNFFENKIITYLINQGYVSLDNDDLNVVCPLQQFHDSLGGRLDEDCIINFLQSVLNDAQHLEHDADARTFLAIARKNAFALEKVLNENS